MRKVGNPMTRYERRQFFDRLVQLRALYRLRGSDDSTVAISIRDAIELAEAGLTDEAEHSTTDAARPEVTRRRS